MAKAKKAKRTSAAPAQRARKQTKTTKRATGKTASARARSAPKASSRKSGMMGGMFDFVPSNLMQNVLSSQTSRVIMAEALVAAAGAAAAVLVASRTDTGQRATKALADGGTLVKEAAMSAASAARDVIASGATEAIGSAARSLMGAAEDTQHDLAEKALRLKRDAEDAADNIADHSRRHAERDRPH